MAWRECVFSPDIFPGRRYEAINGSMSFPSDKSCEQAAALLDSCTGYKILRKLRPVTHFHVALPGRKSSIGVAVDVETTGLDSDADKIIELAIQRFRFDELGRIIEVELPRIWREDPQCELDPRITKLTGLTRDMLEGQTIDEQAARDMLLSADLIVAHNAAFDRPFIDKRLSIAAGKAWACSMAELDWLELGFDGRSLAYLVAQCGWFYEGHRAENDILALIYLLAHDLPNGRTILAELIDCSSRASYQVNAVNAPFEAKDILRARGYRWNGIKRFWSKDIPEIERTSEDSWLKENVYSGKGEPLFILVSARDRYKNSK